MPNELWETNPSKFSIDLSHDKYRSRYDRLLNILFYSGELPVYLYEQLYMTDDNYRKTLSILMKRGWIKSLHKDGATSYILSTKGKDLVNQLHYMKYQDCLEDDRRQYDFRRRIRRWQFSLLYALFDRVDIPYESFSKSPIREVILKDDKVCFYTALDFKRMLGIESTIIKGSRLLGFLIGRYKVIPVYRTNQLLRSFGSHEALVPEYIRRQFNVDGKSAVLVCSDNEAVADITNQFIRGISYGKKDKSMNTAQYKQFYVLPSDDTFLSHFNDLYEDRSETEQRIIRQYGIDTTDRDRYGRLRYMIGTGYIDNFPVMVYPGDVNVVSLRVFIRSVEIYGMEGYIFSQERDAKALEKITEDTPIRVITI